MSSSVVIKMFRLLLTFSLWILCLVFQLAEGFQFADDNSALNNQELDRMKLDDWPMQTNSVNVDALGGNFSNYFPSSNFEKRNNPHLKYPCTCPSKTIMINLGDNAFPRHHVSKICDEEKIARSESVCKFGTTCKEFQHKILVLRSKTPDMPNIEEKYELPRTIRKLFVWDTQEFSIDCRCAY